MLPESVQNILEAENEEDWGCKCKKQLLEQFSQKAVSMMLGNGCQLFQEGAGMT